MASDQDLVIETVRGLLARWSTLVGPANAAHSRPEAFADTVLTVSVPPLS